MPTGDEMRELRRAAGYGLGAMAERCHYSKSYLGLVETGRKPVTPDVVAAYERVLGVGLHDDDVNRREFLAVAASVAANAVLVTDLKASLAGGDSSPLAYVQTSHSVDRTLAASIDGPTIRRLHRWMVDESSENIRVNAAGILAKLPGQTLSDPVVQSLRHDADVQHRYLTAVVARVCSVDRPVAAGWVQAPETCSTPVLVAQRLAAETTNPHDAGARWCSATMLANLSPYLGR